MLFTFAAVLAWLAWLKRRKRVKQLVDEGEEQEKLYPSDPSWSYAHESEGDTPQTPPARTQHWYDQRREQKPPSIPSAEELKHWLEDPKDPTK